MYTSAELQLLRNADPGVRVPGIDTAAGNPLSAGSLKALSSLSTDSSAPIYYDAVNNRVVIQQARATFSGYDLGSAAVVVNADNVTIKDCNFSAAAGWYAIRVYGSHGNTTVTENTFDGGGVASKLSAWVTSAGQVTITNNRFIDTPADGLDLYGSGVVSGNYFSGAGYTSAGQHPDAIWVTNTSGPLTISNNFIDWTPNPDSIVYTNDCIRITAELGSVGNVTVSGNFLIGGSSSIDAGNAGSAGTFSNITIANNYLGFASAYGFYPGAMSGVTASGNVVFDYTNPSYSANAWAAYQAAGLPTASVLVSVNGAAISAAASSGPTTLYGSPSAHLYGGNFETVFVPGYGREYLFGGAGANIFAYLTPTGNSPLSSSAPITGFDPAKDVIDLSRIDANLTAAGVQSFSFVGTSAFTSASAGAQARYQQDAANNCTWVQVTLAGDTAPDLSIQIQGLVTLSAANFALTAAQSKTDIANGAALSFSSIRSGSATEYFYANVRGRPYASYASITYGSTVAADDLNLSATTNELDLFQSNITITRGGSAEGLAIGGAAFKLARHAKETIKAVGVGNETFNLSSGFGAVTIDGFVASGSNADTIQFATSAFSYLNSSMTQAQDLAAVLAHASNLSSSATIVDSAGDSLTLSGVTGATLAANAGAIKFV